MKAKNKRRLVGTRNESTHFFHKCGNDACRRCYAELHEERAEKRLRAQIEAQIAAVARKARRKWERERWSSVRHMGYAP